MSRLLMLLLVALLGEQAPAPALRIVVLEGEGAVNIIQQKTAVRPLIEVRDRNNVPVAGATVTFTIGGGQPAAFAGGLQTMTVTTNAAGQAAAGGFNVLGSGAVQIQVQAAYQGQIATAAISQTNFATAAAASQAGAAAGGGISGTTLGIVGAAIAGGVVAATQLTGSDETGIVDDGGRQTGPPYSGPFSGQIVVTTITASANQSTACTSTRNISGTLTITLRNGVATGNAEIRGSQSEVSVAGSACTPLSGSQAIAVNVAMSGGPSSLAFTSETSATGSTPNGGGSVTATETYKFTGAVSGATITGLLGYQHATRGTNVVNGVSSTITGNGSTSIEVTLRQ
jgi:hypothetical protein